MVLVLCALTTLSPGGCAHFTHHPKIHYRAVAGRTATDTETAKAKYEQALEQIGDCNQSGAEGLLRESLRADASYGPAHNALGKIYFDQCKNYLAALEFDKANELMPGRGEPLNNLGLVFESVGQLDRAVTYFEEAVATDQENAQFLGNLVRCRIRRGDKTADLRDWLQLLILLDTRPTWVEWAKGQLAYGKIEDPARLDFELMDEGFNNTLPYSEINVAPGPPDMAAEYNESPKIEPPNNESPGLNQPVDPRK